MENSEPPASIAAWQSAIDLLPGRRLALRHDALKRTYALHAANAAELMSALEVLHNPLRANELLEVGNREGFLRYLDDVTRKLNNYLASTSTLIDHTRVLVNELWSPEEDFRSKEYQPRVLVFSTNPQLSFVRDLRNYQMHYRLPPLQTLSRFSDLGEENEVVLGTEALLGWSGWKAASKKFLGEHPEHVPVFTTILFHWERLEIFYNWFGFAFSMHFLELLRDYSRMQQRFEAWLSERSGMNS